MDEMDAAQRQEELAREAALKRREPALPVTGLCYWCQSEAPGRCFCSPECAQDWQANMRRLRIGGKA